MGMSPYSGHISVHKTTDNNLWYPDNERNPATVLNSDAMIGSHHLYIAATPHQYTFIWDDTLVSYSGDFSRSSYIGTEQKIYFSDNTFTRANAVFSGICIRSSDTGLSIDATTKIATTLAASDTVDTLQMDSNANLGVRMDPDPKNTGTMVFDIAIIGLVFLICAAGTFFLRKKWINQQEDERGIFESGVLQSSPLTTAAIARIVSEAGIDVENMEHSMDVSRDGDIEVITDLGDEHPIMPTNTSDSIVDSMEERDTVNMELEHSRIVQFRSDTSLTRVASNAMSAARSVSKQNNISIRSQRPHQRPALSTKPMSVRSLSPGMIDSKYGGSPKKSVKSGMKSGRSSMKLGKSAPIRSVRVTQQYSNHLSRADFPTMTDLSPSKSVQHALACSEEEDMIEELYEEHDTLR